MAELLNLIALDSTGVPVKCYTATVAWFWFYPVYTVMIRWVFLTLDVARPAGSRKTDESETEHKD